MGWLQWLCIFAVSLLAQRVDWNQLRKNLVVKTITSLCLRREWIEIHWAYQKTHSVMSLCLRREWIEICVIILLQSLTGVSLLAQRVDWNKGIVQNNADGRGLSACAESGLKCQLLQDGGRKNRSLCLRREWIEIFTVMPTGNPFTSLCLRREWIEIKMVTDMAVMITVSLLAQRVDWNGKLWPSTSISPSLSACAESGLKSVCAEEFDTLKGLSACAESGLKFVYHRQNKPVSQSLCLRGEWIEIA